MNSPKIKNKHHQTCKTYIFWNKLHGSKAVGIHAYQPCSSSRDTRTRTHRWFSGCDTERPVHTLVTQIVHLPNNLTWQRVKNVKYVLWGGQSEELICIFLSAIVLFPDHFISHWQMDTLLIKRWEDRPTIATSNHTHTYAHKPWDPMTNSQHKSYNHQGAEASVMGNQSVMPVWESSGQRCIIGCARPDRFVHS